MATTADEPVLVWIDFSIDEACTSVRGTFKYFPYSDDDIIELGRAWTPLIIADSEQEATLICKALEVLVRESDCKVYYNLRSDYEPHEWLLLVTRARLVARECESPDLSSWIVCRAALDALELHRSYCDQLASGRACISIKEDAAREPLTDDQQRAYDYIKEHGPKTAKEIVNALALASESSFTSHSVPVLKRRGVKNKPGAGYYLADKSI
ncbi:MAG TPA: hypothetical protein VG713_02560 [Pirellulales bacterium]|nr:hypothetical protein [Pirellulales bacterium]